MLLNTLLVAIVSAAVFFLYKSLFKRSEGNLSEMGKELPGPKG
jgi:hypothetical protein